MANHKYIERKWKNGRWEYKYRTDDRSADQLRRDTEREKAYRERMVKQAYRNYDNLSSRWVEDPKELRANDRAWEDVRRNNGLYTGRFNNEHAKRILNPESKQKEMEYSYKAQSLGTRIKSDARSLSDDVKTKAKEFKDTVSKAISDKKAHNLMLKQNKKAAKNAAKAQKEAPKIAEKIAKSNKKMSEISPKNTKAGEDFLTKLLVSDYQRMLLGDKKPKK